MTYRAPIDDIMLALKAAAGLPELIDKGVVDLDQDTLRAILEEAGKFGTEVLDPLNVVGDRTGSKLVDGKVVTPQGWNDAYKAFVEGGWGALTGPPAHSSARSTNTTWRRPGVTGLKVLSAIA